nr:MAG: HPr family phosphocarrier protein [Gemmatimonadota bacterium]
MVELTAIIQNRMGMHMRPADQIVRTASKYDSTIKLIKDGVGVNAKSILGVLMLEAGKGSEITIQADGVDEQDAVDAIKELIDNKFYEE